MLTKEKAIDFVKSLAYCLNYISRFKIADYSDRSGLIYLPVAGFLAGVALCIAGFSCRNLFHGASASVAFALIFVLAYEFVTGLRANQAGASFICSVYKNASFSKAFYDSGNLPQAQFAVSAALIVLRMLCFFMLCRSGSLVWLISACAGARTVQADIFEISLGGARRHKVWLSYAACMIIAAIFSFGSYNFSALFAGVFFTVILAYLARRQQKGGCDSYSSDIWGYLSETAMLTAGMFLAGA